MHAAVGAGGFVLCSRRATIGAFYGLPGHGLRLTAGTLIIRTIQVLDWSPSSAQLGTMTVN